MRDDSALFYERFAERFDGEMNRYDLDKRLALVFDRLAPRVLRGARLLDAGCGTGHFSLAAASRGADVWSLDLGVRLLRKVAEKVGSRRIAADLCQLPFADGSFDVVIASEVLEHMRRPKTGFGELARVLRPGGTLVVTTPNRLWYGAVVVAQALRLRPYRGIENWIWPQALRRWCRENALHVEAWLGFHLLPPVRLRAVQRAAHHMDRFGIALRSVTLNVALAARKPLPGPGTSE